MEEMFGELVANSVVVTAEWQEVMVEVQQHASLIPSLGDGGSPVQVSVALCGDVAASPAGTESSPGAAVSSSVGAATLPLVCQVQELTMGSPEHRISDL